MHENNLPTSYVVFDLETTGLEYDCEIIEIGAVKVVNDEIVDTFEELIKPTRRIPESASKVNGITDDTVKNSRSAENVLNDFMDFIKYEILIGHNVKDFDFKVLLHNVMRFTGKAVTNRTVDTMSMARLRLQLPNYRLSTLCEFFSIVNDNAHRALSDATATYKCYIALKNYDEKENSEFSHSKNGFKSSADSRTLHKESKIFSLDVSGKNVCLTGDFLCGGKEDISQMLIQQGAIMSENVTKKTDVLIVGGMGSEAWKYGSYGGKIKKAMELKSGGSVIQIIHENGLDESPSEVEYFDTEESNLYDGGETTVFESLEKEVRQIMSEACREQEIDEKYVTCRAVQGGYSAWICEPINLKEVYRAFSITVKGKKEPHYEVEILYKRIGNVPIPEEADYNEIRGSVRFSIYSSTMHKYLVDVLSYGLEHFEPSNDIKIGCCGKFRECSDAKRCLKTDKFYARVCHYHKNLEAGKIFYGKNRNIE